MGTKTVSSTQNSYNPQSMNAFNTMTPQAQNILSQYMGPATSNPNFNLGLQQISKAANQIGQNQSSNMFKNLNAGGFAGNSGALTQSMLGQNSRATAGALAQGTNQNYLNYQLMQQQATNAALNYKPLQTGQTNTQQTSGLGTWLPQTLGMAANVGLGIATGGLSTAAQAASGGLSGAIQNAFQAPSPGGTGFSGSGINPGFMNGIPGMSGYGLPGLGGSMGSYNGTSNATPYFGQIPGLGSTGSSSSNYNPWIQNPFGGGH